MRNTSHRLKPQSGISHPLVADMYLRKNARGRNHEDVLVIETKRLKSKILEGQGDSQNQNLMNLLIDLEDIKNKAEEKFGHFDWVDIRTS